MSRKAFPQERMSPFVVSLQSAHTLTLQSDHTLTLQSVSTLSHSDLAEEDGVADVLRDLGVDVPEHGHPPRVLVLALVVAGHGVPATVAAGAEQDGGKDLCRGLGALGGRSPPLLLAPVVPDGV